MKAKFQFLSCIIAGTFILFISSGNLFAQIQSENKSKLDITIDKDGEQIRIDTLIDSSQLPQLFEELNRQMPALENLIQDLGNSFNSESLEQFFGQENSMFQEFFNEDFQQNLENSFGELFKSFEELENSDFEGIFKQLEDNLQNLDLEGLNLEGFRGFDFDNFDTNGFNPKSRAQLGVVLSEKAIDGITDITVNEVVKGSVAEKAGILKGDKIISIDGQNANHINDITRAVKSKKDKDILKIEIERNGIPATLDVEMDVPKPINEKIKKV